MKKINLEQLYFECDIINESEANSIKGGDQITDFFNSHPQGTYSQSEVMTWGDNTYGSNADADWWKGYGGYNNPIALNEVVVYGGVSRGIGFSTKQFGTNNFAWKFWMDNSGQMTADQGGYNYSAQSVGGYGTAGYSQNAVNYLGIASLYDQLSLAGGTFASALPTFENLATYCDMASMGAYYLNNSGAVRALSALNTIANAGGVVMDVNALKNYYQNGNGNMDGVRFSIRTLGTGASIIEASIVGGPQGVVIGAIAAGGVMSAEASYDGVLWWINEMAKGITDYQNALSNGWVLGR